LIRCAKDRIFDFIYRTMFYLSNHVSLFACEVNAMDGLRRPMEPRAAPGCFRIAEALTDA